MTIEDSCTSLGFWSTTVLAHVELDKRDSIPPEDRNDWWMLSRKYARDPDRNKG